MQGKTHRMGGSVAALGGYLLLKRHGYLVPDIEPVLQLAIIYPFAMWGSIAPDLDHHADSTPAKDPISKGINWLLLVFNKPADKIDKTLGLFSHRRTPLQKLVQVLKCKHRSWQTHSEVTALVLWLLYTNILQQPVSVENTILILMLTGLILGILSHIVLDMLTTAGVPTVLGRTLSTILPIKIRNIRLVPRSPIFATGTLYETYVFRVLSLVASGLMLYIVLDQLGLVYLFQNILS